ncbi:hypothetical protein [Nonomuraea cavernae]|uniref:Uncharacterized protein n=1 Tax=Nonomuraea cavernae TaxID=2045107 RepID=A0A917Z7Y7_9ACTN|nr:hypothetical protein [Nonomuraea cavernae]MCA2189822.1 hypothetical protein [Nonomuraea cavernae]GGO77592.1 hypothetical protein GCM10012289_57610 [Nonomuraea cavernae]
MAGFEIYFDALSDCADRALHISKQFKGMADESPPAVSAKCFGDLSGKSDKLGDAVNKLEKMLDTESRYAEQNLLKVEGALHTVINNIKRSDNPDNPNNQVKD